MLSKLILIWFSVINISCGYVRVCYFTNWAQYRPGNAKFTPAHIDYDLCTHIIYAFAKIVNSKLTMTELSDVQMYNEIVKKSKLHNPKLKVLLAVGGYNHESKSVSPFSEMVNNEDSLQKFIDGSVEFLRQYKFDGLDLDWEYPTKRGNSRETDKIKFTSLCQGLAEAFKKETPVNTGNTRLILTAAVSAGEATINSAYEVEKLGAHLDTLHLMSYDLHGAWEGKTGHHTSMQATDPSSVASGLNVWIKRGFPSSKIALGLATYGRSFTLKNKINYGLGDASIGYGAKQKYTRENGYAAYYEVCEEIRNGLVVVKGTDNVANAPYGHKENYWIGYDDEESLKYKVNKLIIGKKLKGAMFWAIDLDDFTGMFCNGKKFPLLNAVKKALSSTNIPKPATTRPATTTSVTKEPVTTKQICWSTGDYCGQDYVDDYCKLLCNLESGSSCPTDICACGTSETNPCLQEEQECWAAGAWCGEDKVSAQCKLTCNLQGARRFCPETHCVCGKKPTC